MNHVLTGNDKPRSYNGDYMKTGKKGEEVALAWLKNNPEIMGVIDFRNIREVHEADVDAGIRLYAGPVLLVEIKTDTYLGNTGNVLYEVLRINHHCPHQYAGYLGWSLRSPAQYLIFYAPNRKDGPALYKTTFEAYRKALQKYTQNHDLSVLTVHTDDQKTTYNVLVPELDVGNIFEVYEV